MERTRRISWPSRPGLRRVLLAGLAAGSAIMLTPASASTQNWSAPLREIVQDDGREFAGFYQSRDWEPLWIEQGQVSPAGEALLELVRYAEVDGVKAKKLRARDLARTLNRARDGDPEHLAKAELALSRTLAAYVRAMRAAPHAEMQYESLALQPVVPTARAVLDAAAAAPSLERYVETMGWMHPFYAGLRNALASGSFTGESEALLRLNLERVRAIPAINAGRYVVVDAANARLYMYDNGEIVDSMKVVVGKPDNQTPMMAGFLRYAQVNPYWNVPPDLVQQRIAANVLSRGLGYLRTSRYQVLDGWEDDAKVINPASVDWQAVAAGTAEARVRQLPGGDNFMGKVKFMFPNPQGIYLHDTPDKQLMVQDERQFSSGCVRLEDAARFGKWLMGKPLPTRVKKPETRVDLPEVVPLYITYLTATVAPGRGIAFAPDVYGRDATRLASLGGGNGKGR
jgi:murein L,D-transpeptidase YcbB/YkuD